LHTGTHEQTINTALGEVLQQFGREWTLRSENIGRIFEEGGRPDILVEKSDGWPITIEAEVGNLREAEDDARARLGNRLISTGNPIHASLALVYPDDLRQHHGEALRAALRRTQLQYALFTVQADGQTARFPQAGWLQGGVAEFALLLHRSSIPAWRVVALADALELGVNRAARRLSARHPVGSNLGRSLADLLGQHDDAAGQTRRMAMTVLVDALVFHVAIAESELEVYDPNTGPRRVTPPTAFRENATFRPTRLVDEWQKILAVNYWPIFHTASRIVQSLPTATAAAVLNILWETAETLIVGGVTRSHDLTGVVFQRLIADRKFLATYYTMPSGAALLAGLAIPLQHPLVGDDWGDANALAVARIGDFACGTGTLLSTAYQRIGLLHEIRGGDPKALHPRMMERGLVGLDVLTVAVHLTAAMLAGTYPDTPFEGECLLTMPYGSHTWGVCVGSLDLLLEQPAFGIIEAAAQTAGGRGAEEVRDLVFRVGHGHFDLVIMNPPFTRHGAHEGDRTEVHNPAFAAFGADEEEQDRLSQRLKEVARGSSAHGHAGLASFFAELAHRKLADGGRLALVLPLSSMSGVSWDGIREQWRSDYSSLIVVTIAETGTHTRSFSADTGMAECLFVGTKSAPAGEPRATFIILSSQPKTTLEGELIAEAITKAIAELPIRTLECGPFGGTRIFLGDTAVGEALDCPLPDTGAWQMVGLKDTTLAQTAYQLSIGRLWVEGMSPDALVQIPVCSIREAIERIGPHHLDITGPEVKNDGLPQGPFEKFPGLPDGAAYPCLWNHDNSRERRLVVEPDSYCRIRDVDGDVPRELQDRADARWATAARVHYNLDLQFNSQSLAVAMTPERAIGGRAWPTVILNNLDQDYTFALWSNSTLGLLCHWWMSNKTQKGRGTVTVTSILEITTIDVRAISADQHRRARNVFERLSDRRFLPFDQVDEDEARAELDRSLLVEVLGLDPGLCERGGALERLRQKLAAEPQIHADKRTRVLFTPDGETSSRRPQHE
jgi:NAD(P)-dependent dehydrogenase (short-subunit alcohol dehydrogenase family)